MAERAGPGAVLLPRVVAGARRQLGVPAGVGAVAFAGYALTLSRGVLGGDAGELQFVPPILGLTHPTGYPLQVLLHAAWAHLPLGSVAYALNLLDAIIAAVAVALVVALTRQVGVGWASAAVAGLALAFGELWWSQAVRGDKYTLNGLFLALVLLLLVRFRAHPDRRALTLLALAYGFSLAHHRSMLLLGPALALGAWPGVIGFSRRPAGRSGVMLAVALGLAPLLLYAYVPWAGARGLPPGSWPVDTPGRFLEYLLDRGYTSQIRPDAAFGGRLGEEARVLLRSFGPLGAALGLAGLLAAFRRDRHVGAILVLAFAPQAVLGASYLLESHYELPRHWVFFLPGFVIWSVWLGIGLDAALGAVHRLGHDRRRLLAPAVVLLVVGILAGTAWVRGAIALVRAEAGAETLDAWRQDLQRSPVAERFGRLALAEAAVGATIVCDWEQATVLWYFQRVEGLRPDLTIRYPIESLDAAVTVARADGRAVYLARTLPGIESHGVISSRGPLLLVLPATGSPSPASAGPPLPAIRFDGGLALVGLRIHDWPLQPGSVIAFSPRWQADRPLGEAYAVSVRLLGADGAVLARHDTRHPALGTSPTSGWPAGVQVEDYYELPLGSRLRPGTYQIEVVPYRAEPIEELRQLGADGKPGEAGARFPIVVAEPTGGRPLDLLTRLLAR